MTRNGVLNLCSALSHVERGQPAVALSRLTDAAMTDRDWYLLGQEIERFLIGLMAYADLEGIRWLEEQRRHVHAAIRVKIRCEDSPFVHELSAVPL